MWLGKFLPEELPFRKKDFAKLTKIKLQNTITTKLGEAL